MKGGAEFPIFDRMVMVGLSENVTFEMRTSKESAKCTEASSFICHRSLKVEDHMRHAEDRKSKV